MINLLQHSMFEEVLFPSTKSQQSAKTTELCLRKHVRFQTHPAQNIKDSTWVIFDFETTGLDSSYDRIIEIGAQKIQNNVVIDQFESLIDIKQDLPNIVQKLSGITNKMLKGQPTIESI